MWMVFVGSTLCLYGLLEKHFYWHGFALTASGLGVLVGAEIVRALEERK